MWVVSWTALLRCAVKEAHRQAAKIVTDRLTALRQEQQNAAAKDQARIAALKQRQNAAQADERTKMDVLHKMRERRETKERDARIFQIFLPFLRRRGLVQPCRDLFDQRTIMRLNRAAGKEMRPVSGFSDGQRRAVWVGAAHLKMRNDVPFTGLLGQIYFEDLP